MSQKVCKINIKRYDTNFLIVLQFRTDTKHQWTPTFTLRYGRVINFLNLMTNLNWDLTLWIPIFRLLNFIKEILLYMHLYPSENSLFIHSTANLLFQLLYLTVHITNLMFSLKFYDSLFISAIRYLKGYSSYTSFSNTLTT